MRTRWERLGALAVALTLVTGGVSALGAHPASAAAPIQVRGTEFGAPLYRMQESAPDVTENEAAEGPEAVDGMENEAAESAENEAAEAPGDEAVDGVDCVQQGEHEGENEGC